MSLGRAARLLILWRHASPVSRRTETPTPHASPSRRRKRRSPGRYAVSARTGEPVDADPRIAERGNGGTGAPSTVLGGARDRRHRRCRCRHRFRIGLRRRAGNTISTAPSVVEVDGVTAPSSMLRAGQVVAIRTRGAGGLFAEASRCRREVSGTIDGVELGPATLTIAGQAVSVPPGTWGADTALGWATG